MMQLTNCFVFHMLFLIDLVKISWSKLGTDDLSHLLTKIKAHE